MSITAPYAGLLGLLYVVLTGKVIRTRGVLKVSLGDGGHELLQRRIRAHGNFAEYVPIALLLIAFVEYGGGESLFVHALGSALVARRIAHGYALSSLARRPAARVVGMGATLAVISVAAFACLAKAVIPLFG